MASFWERDVHSVKRMFSLYYVYSLFCFSHFGFEGWTVVLIVPAPGHCLPFTFLFCSMP